MKGLCARVRKFNYNMISYDTAVSYHTAEQQCTNRSGFRPTTLRQKRKVKSKGPCALQPAALHIWYGAIIELYTWYLLLAVPPLVLLCAGCTTLHMRMSSQKMGRHATKPTSIEAAPQKHNSNPPSATRQARGASSRAHETSGCFLCGRTNTRHSIGQIAVLSTQNNFLRESSRAPSARGILKYFLVFL